MQAFIEYGWMENYPLYSCKKNNMTYDQLSARHEKQILLGVGYITYGLFVQICYALSLAVIAQKEFLHMSCYKIMLTLGILDVICVSVSSELTGYFYIIGWEYCMAPNLTYFCGCWMNFFFNTCCMLCFILVVNRFVDFWKPHISEFLFAGHRTWFSIGLAILYGAMWLMLPLPVLFNSDFGTWIYYPFIPNNPEHDFKSVYQVFHNVFICGGIILLYIAIYFLHMHKMKKYQIKADKAQRQILIQASLVIMFTFITATTWVVMLFVTPTTFVMHVAHASWQLMHGTPAFVYMFLNKTIQRKALINAFPSLAEITIRNSVAPTGTMSKIDEKDKQNFEK